MAKFNYESYVANDNHSTNNGGSNNFGDRAKVIFLSSLLKNDGDSVVVRLPYENHNQFDLAGVHKVALKSGGFRNISCLRENTDAVDKCPLCASGNTPKGKFFVKGITYVQDGDKIDVVPFVWERPAAFAKEINGYIAEYGPLANVPLKIKRQGAKGDTNTKYVLLPANTQIYNTQTYPVDFSGLDNLDISKFAYVELNYNEVSNVVLTGELPKKENKQEVKPQTQPANNQGASQGYVQPTYTPDPLTAESNPFPSQKVEPATYTSYGAPQQQAPQSAQPQGENPQGQQDVYRPRRVTY